MNNIYLQELNIINFQKHSHLTLQFSSLLNVLLGETDSGKSCIIRAIGFLLYNSISGDSVRKEGSKTTSVKGIFSNGVTVERIKSKTVNRYILNIPGQEEKVFDSIGRDIPQEVKDTLGLDYFEVDGQYINLNIAQQISLPFLLDKTGSFRNKLFNRLTGADRIDNAMQSLNKDILELNRQEKSCLEFIENNKDKLENYQTKITQQKELLGKVLGNIEQLSYNIEHYNSIKENEEKLVSINNEISKLTKKEINIPITEKEIKELDQKIERLEQLNKCYLQLKQLKINFNNLKDKLQTLNIPEIDMNRLNENINKINKYRRIIKELKEIGSISDSLISQGDNLIKELEKSKKEYKEILKKSGICPTCKTELTDKHIKEIKL